MSDTGDSADPIENGPLCHQTELGDGDRCLVRSGSGGRRDGPLGDLGSGDIGRSGSGDASSEAWQRLLQAARGGCRESQATLFSAVRQQLVTLANQGVDHQLQAKIDGSDVVQETFIDAVRGIGAFRGETRADWLAWLRGILVHRMADTRRHYDDAKKRRVTREVPLDQSLAIFADDTSPSGRAMRHESEERLERILRRLPEPDELVIRLRNQLDLTLVEVASALGCSRNAASKRWLRALRHLRQELERADSA